MSPAKIKLNATSGGGSVSLEAPSSTTGNANVEFKLPVADGVGSLVSDGSGNLSIGGGGGGAAQISKDLTLASGASATTAKAVNINQSGQLEQLPTMSSIGTFVADNNYVLRPADVTTPGENALSGGGNYSTPIIQDPYVRYSKSLGVAPYRVRITNSISSNVGTMTIQGQVINADGTYTNGSTTQTLSADSNNPSSGVQSDVRQWYANYWVAVVWSRRYATGSSSSNYTKTAIQMFTVDPSNGNITMLGSRLTLNWNYGSGHSIAQNSATFSSRWNAPTINLKSAFGNRTKTRYYKPTTSGISLIDTFENNSDTANASDHALHQDGNGTIYAAQTSALISAIGEFRSTVV